MKPIIKFLGFGQEKQSFFKITNFLKNPLTYFKTTTDSHEELVLVLALLIRLYILIDIAIQFWRQQLSEVDLVIFGIVFFLARQISQIILWINSRILNLFVRLLFKKHDVLAAEKAYTYSVLPFLLYHIAGVTTLLSSLWIHLLCYAAALILRAIGLTKQYKLSYWFSGGIAFGLSISLWILFYFLPFYLSVEFSPSVVKEDVDLSVLEFTEVEIDSSVDGSWVLKALRQLCEEDSIKLTETPVSTRVVTKDEIPQLAHLMQHVTPLFEATYINNSS